MKNLKKILFIFLIGLAYISIMYFTFSAVARVQRAHDPMQAKRIVVLTFFAIISIFAGSAYLIYKLKVSTEKK